MKQNQKHCFRKIGGGKLTLSNHRGKALLAALLLTGAFCVPAEAAAERSAPLTVTDKNQTVSDDFKNVSIADGKTPAILEIASTAAADEKGVTTVNSKTINGTFTVGGSKDNVAEANGIWVQDNYPGTVRLANGLNVKVDTAGDYYNTSGIYLEGVDTHHGVSDESDAANAAYEKNGGHISSTTVNVGKGTAITVNAKTPENQVGTNVCAVALENHFGHMTVGDNVTLSLKVGNFKYNQAYGFYSLFYGDTRIGDHFASTAEAVADKETGQTLIRALESVHDHPSDHQITALTHNLLTIGSDAHLISTIGVQSPSQENQGQLINNEGILLSRTDFSIGDGMTVETSQEGVDTEPEKSASYGKGHVVGIYVQDTKNGTIGAGLKNTVTVDKRNADFAYGLFLSGWQQTKNKNPAYNPSEEDKERDTADISIKEYSHNDVSVKDSAVRHITGISLNSNSKLYIGDYGETSITQTGGKAANIDGIDAEDGSIVKEKKYNRQNITVNHGSVGSVTGINAVYGSTVNLGENNQDNMMIDNGSVQNIYGIYSVVNSGVNLGKNGVLSITQNDGSISLLYGVSAELSSAVDIGKDSILSIIQNGGKVSTIYGLEAYDDSTISAVDGLRVSIDSTGNAANSVYGVYNYSKSHMSVGNDSTVSAIVKNTSQETKTSVVSGMRNILSESSFGNNLHVQVQADNYETAEGIRNTGVDAAKATMKIGDNLSVAVKASELSSGKEPTVEGIRNGTNHIAGYTFTDGKNTALTVGKNAHIIVTAPDKVTDVSALHSFNHADAEICDNAVLTVNSLAQNSKDKILNNVVKADDAGHVNFDGGMTLVGSGNAIYSTDDGSSVIAMGNGRKVILGNLESAKNGSIQLNLNTADSYFRGKSTIDSSATTSGAAASTHGLMAVATAADDSSTVDTTSADTELSLADGARWDMTGTSQLTKLTHENGGLVNMAYNPSYQRLDVNAYSGKNGIFRMKTDLDSEIDGDKVYMSSAAAGSSGLVQVHDESFLLGKEVTGTKHLLLITDGSKNATFSGLSLDEGGLWDVTPTIQNGQYVHDVMGVADANDKQWYLTKLERKINKDTIPLMKAADNSYALYRLDIDSLRKRMGDLRFRNLKDTSGLWARDFHGAYDGRGVDSRYNGFQLGYDYAANDKSVYGFFAERNISNPKYSYGSSKDHGLSGGLYGTWLGDSGVYTDVVAKWGRDDTELHSWGGYPDSANYRTWNESLSVEFGKTFTGDNGLFFEPEAQMVFGHLGSKDYTTSRGKTVSMGSYDSAIGRLGILLGKRVTNRENPYDYYLKFSVLHEFGGERNFHLAAPDGETMDYSEDYRDTWYEAGFGGTWHINGNTSIYADAERSFSGDWHKKWQWNVGVNWQF